MVENKKNTLETIQIDSKASLTIYFLKCQKACTKYRPFEQQHHR